MPRQYLGVCDARRLAAARPFVVAFWCLTLLAALAVSAACGDGGEEGAATPADQMATPVDEATFVPLPPVGTNVPLVEFSSPDKGYSVSYPEGWEADTSPGATDMFLWEADGRRVALLQVTCNSQLLTPDELMSADAGVSSRFGGNLNSAAAVPVEVGGLEGKRNTYGLTVGGLRVEHVVVYLPGDECGWRVGLSTFGEGTRDAFLPLFDRIIETFQPG